MGECMQAFGYIIRLRCGERASSPIAHARPARRRPLAARHCRSCIFSARHARSRPINTAERLYILPAGERLTLLAFRRQGGFFAAAFRPRAALALTLERKLRFASFFASRRRRRTAPPARQARDISFATHEEGRRFLAAEEAALRARFRRAAITSAGAAAGRGRQAMMRRLRA